MPSGRPDVGLLGDCVALPLPKAGVTNESLAQGFLDARAGLLICQGAARALVSPDAKE